MTTVLEAIMAGGSSCLPLPRETSFVAASMYSWQPSPPYHLETLSHGARSSLSTFPARKRVPLQIIDSAKGFEVEVGPPSEAPFYIQPSATHFNAATADLPNPNHDSNTRGVPGFPIPWETSNCATIAGYEHLSFRGVWDTGLEPDQPYGWSQPCMAADEAGEMSAWSERYWQAAANTAGMRMATDPYQVSVPSAEFTSSEPGYATGVSFYPYPYPYPSSRPYPHPYPEMTTDDMEGEKVNAEWLGSNQAWGQGCGGWSEEKVVESDGACEGEEKLCPPGMEEGAEVEWAGYGMSAARLGNGEEYDDVASSGKWEEGLEEVAQVGDREEEEEEGDMVVEVGKEGPEFESGSEVEGVAMEMVEGGAKMEVKEEVIGGGEEVGESRPIEIEDGVVIKSGNGESQLQNLSSSPPARFEEEGRRGEEVATKFGLKCVWGHIVGWMKARDEGWKRTMARVDEAVLGIQSEPASTPAHDGFDDMPEWTEWHQHRFVLCHYV